jgi:hypothetical protein
MIVDLKWFKLDKSGTALLLARRQSVRGEDSRGYVIEILRGLLVGRKDQAPIEVLITKSSSRYH